MLVTGICHTEKMVQCPLCEARIPMDAQRCPKCGVRILIIRRRRSKNHRTAKEKPSGDSAIQKILVIVSMSGRDCGSIANMSTKHWCCSSDRFSIAVVGCA